MALDQTAKWKSRARQISGKEPRELARRRRTIFRKLLSNKVGFLGLVIVVVELIVALLAPVLAPHDPLYSDLAFRLDPPFWLGGKGGFILGADQLGRDILSRLAFGARVSLSIAFLSVAVSAPIGIALGIASGYLGGAFDDAVMRLADAQLSIPLVLMAIAVLAILGRSEGNVVLVLGIYGWVLYGRLARGEAISLKQKEYVEAARAIGVPNTRIAWRYILPNLLTPMIVTATFAAASVIIIESELSFLGLGIQPPTPSWGGMIGDGKDYLANSWWVATFPGIAIMISVLGINFLGDWLRDILDPRMKA